MSIGEGREAAIRGLNGYREELIAQIQQMQENLRCVEKSIEILGTANAGQESSTAPGTISKYATLKLKPAVKLFLTENPNRWFKASTVAKELLARGIPKPSKTFASAITSTLNRLAAKGFAVKEERDGVNMYKLNEKGEQGGEGA
jgi:hypothetical protein